MQSFTMNESFPMNAWYAAAWDVELKNELLPRTICNKPLVLYRKKDGTPVVLEDGVVLAEELDKATTVDEAFDAFMKRRYERCMAIVDASETLAEWELLEFEGKPLPEGANIGKIVGQAVGVLMAPI